MDIAKHIAFLFFSSRLGATFLIILPAFVAAHSVHAQMAAPDITWQRCYGGSNDEKAYSIVQTVDGGFAFTGWTLSSDDDVTGYHSGYDVWVAKVDSKGVIEWEKCLGGPGYDLGYSIIQTADSGFAIAGVTAGNGGDVSGYKGGSGTDAWVVKLDKNGTIQWQKCLGGTAQDVANCIIQTKENGYVIAGYTASDDSDVSGFHGVFDVWVAKLDESGNLVEQVCLGGLYADVANSIIQTQDGGFAVAGYTSSNDSEVTGLHGAVSSDKDVWVVKLKYQLTAKDVIEWRKCYGGTMPDVAQAIVQTGSGAFVFAGYTQSNDSDVSGHHAGGNNDVWLVKIDQTGNLMWQKCYGGTYEEQAYSLVKTADGGFAIGGNTNSLDGDAVGDHGTGISPNSIDFWLVKTDSNGVLQWQKCLGGSGDDEATSIVQCMDGGYAMAGFTSSNDGDVSGHFNTAGGNDPNDVWVVRLNSGGDGVEDNSTPTSQIEHPVVFPNPSFGSFSIAYSLAKPAHVRLELYSPLGERIAVPIDEAEAGFKQSHRIDVPNVAAGSYFYRLFIDDVAASGAVAILR